MDLTTLRIGNFLSVTEMKLCDVNLNSGIHNRKSIRLHGYDYSLAGLYFVTLCVKDRECLFGQIEIGASPRIALSELGLVADSYWREIPLHFPRVQLHEHIVMPNHVHGIIELKDQERSFLEKDPWFHQKPTNQRKFSKPVSGSISSIVNQYKSSVKRWCNKNAHVYFQWQPRFHDHIIRSEDEYKKISHYIINNPSRWRGDKF